MDRKESTEAQMEAQSWAKSPSLPMNRAPARNGRSMAVCQCCNMRSKPVVIDEQGEPDMWRLPPGWSQAPYPIDSIHADGSVGSRYTCPSCNRLLNSGHTLRLRTIPAKAPNLPQPTEAEREFLRQQHVVAQAKRFEVQP